MDNDAISRQAAIDALEEPLEVSGTWTDEYAIGARAQWEKDVKVLNSLPSAERHGRWIMHIDDLFPEESMMECDQCHEEQPLTCDDKYCPNCGAKMDESEAVKGE